MLNKLILIMCGIFALLNNENQWDTEYIQSCFNLGVNRGPEHTTYQYYSSKVEFGFHRLAINGLDSNSNQPLTIYNDNYILICNGEIYNYKELYKQLDIIPTTESDCEVILHLYERYGIEQTLQYLDGVYAFILLDKTNPHKNKIYTARDPYGLRPLYVLYSTKKNYLTSAPSQSQLQITSQPIIAFASELKMLHPLQYRKLDKGTEKYEKERLIHRQILGDEIPLLSYFTIEQVPSGTYSELSYSADTCYWQFVSFNKVYHNPYGETRLNPWTTYEYMDIYQQIYYVLDEAVKKRVSTTERPIACLLSGGLDSSLITALVNKHYSGILETYSIGMEGSDDLKFAKEVATHLKTKHTEIILSEKEFLSAIPETIRAIESYDTTTIRASVGNYLIAKYIAKHSKAKVIFNGDGSDEVTGGYIYFHLAPDAIEFDKECKRLLNDIYLFDVQRSDRSIASHGLEARTPFLDKTFIRTYLSIPPEIRFHKLHKQCEKYLLRKSIDVIDKYLLPQSVLWRGKEAFSDGVSGKNKSWYQVIQDFLSSSDSIDIVTLNLSCYSSSLTLEQKYYRYLFDSYYSHQEKILPYYWMPKYTDAKDASARTLDIYKERNPILGEVKNSASK